MPSSNEQRTTRFYFVHYFPGLSLDIWPREHGNFSADDVLAIARQVGDAMRVAHQQGVLHRDLKPENVLVRKVENGWEVKVIDFGLAMRRSTIETSIVAASIGETIIGESVAGTILYAPPEQMGRLPGVKPGTYSDVYAFGKMCCFALFQTTEPKSRQLSTIPSTLADVLERCTEHDIEHRLKNFNIVLELLGMSPPQVKQPKPVVREATEEKASAAQLRSMLRSDLKNIELRRRYLAVRTRQLEDLDAAMGRVGDTKADARGGAIIGSIFGVLGGLGITVLVTSVSYSILDRLFIAGLGGIVMGIFVSIITGIGAWISAVGRDKGRDVGPLPYREYGNSLDELKRAYEIE